MTQQKTKEPVSEQRKNKEQKEQKSRVKELKHKATADGSELDYI